MASRDQQIDEIIARIGDGEPLRQICREPGMPYWRTFYKWMDEDQTGEIKARFARARVDGFDAIADDCLSIADDKTDEPASRRVRVETRLKLLAKWDPKRYGEMVKLADNEGGKLGLASLVSAAHDAG